jgi:TfoX/Sxy family transcriptional regulator of competence genes
MAYDEELADRLRELLADEDGLREQRMFGGLAFMLDGNMTASASGRGGLMVRIDPAATDRALARGNARVIEMRGREMPGWIFVEQAGYRTKRQLQTWVRQAVAHARSLPPKR